MRPSQARLKKFIKIPELMQALHYCAGRTEDGRQCNRTPVWYRTDEDVCELHKLKLEQAEQEKEAF